jgi:RNase H-like domain found in reverse transcriptase
VLKKLRKAKINLKIKKCEFGVKETNFLGHVMTGDTIRMQEEKIQVILKWPTPRNLKDLEKFKGMVGYYRQFIGHFTDIMRKINEKLRRKEFSWNEEDEKIFQDVKNRFKNNQIMGIFDWEKEITVHTDASDYAIGAEISQKDQNGKHRPILFYSRRLSPAEERYSTADKEMLAITQVLKKFPHYLRETKYPVTIKTDHKNLVTFTTNKQLNGRQARWVEELAAYDFTIEHVPGKQNIVADALSRYPMYDTGLKIIETAVKRRRRETETEPQRKNCNGTS